MYTDCIEPIFQEIVGEQRSIYIEVSRFSSNLNDTRFYIRTYRNRDSETTSLWSTYTNKPLANGQDFSIVLGNYASTMNFYTLRYDYSTNSGTLNQSIPVSSSNLVLPTIYRDVRGDLLNELLLCYTGVHGTDSLLNEISNYLDNIKDINTDILSQLVSLSSTLTTLPSQFPNNTSQINNISNKINDILSDNDTIISQNADMIQQQEQINNNLENVNNSVQDLNDTITDDTVESGAEDLPTISVTDPTQNGIDTIFQSIYNAFCVGQAQDIVFPIPFTDKSITLSPYYVRDMLNNNGASWVYTLIQTFWAYLIGRYIVKDILNKITKIKSGNIENIENSNIKGDML